MGRRSGPRHKSGNDLIGDGIKYAGMFGIAHEGFSALGQYNSNKSSGSMQQPQQQQQQQQQQYQQPMGYPQQQFVQYTPQSMGYGPMPVAYPQYQQREFQPQQGTQYREQVVQMQNNVAPPPYSVQPNAGVSGPFAGHKDWCNGQCNGGCSRVANTSSGEAMAYYSGDGVGKA